MGLTLAEATIRLWFRDEAVPRADHEEREYFCEFDDTLGWRGKPLARGTFSSTDFKTFVHLNSLGLRDQEIAPPGDKVDPSRTLLLGDSFVWGLGVQDSEIVDRRMESLLGAGREVVNAGVSGYGPDQELLYYTSRGVLLGSSSVVLFLFTDNDFEDISSSIGNRHQKPVFLLQQHGDERPSLEIKNVPVPSEGNRPAGTLLRLRRWLEGRVCLYGFVIGRLGLWDRFEAVAGEGDLRWNHPDEGYTDAVMALILIRLNEETHRAGSRLSVVLVPPRRALLRLGADKRDRHLERAALIEEVGRQDGFPVLDLLQDLDASLERGELPYYKHDIHWNPLGHEIAARAAVRLLQSEERP